MSINAYAEQICSVLDELALPRAFVHSQLDRFVAWNSQFLNALNIPEDEIKSLVASEIVCFEDGFEFDDGLLIVPCSAHLLQGSKSLVNGHAVMVPGGLAFVMLDVSAPAGQVFQSSLAAAVDDERNRLYRFLHDRMSPRLMAVAFLAESLAERLGTTQPEAAEEAAEIRRLLGAVFDQMHLLFAPPLVSTKSDANP
jgi:signal transduction histidine kinase